MKDPELVDIIENKRVVLQHGPRFLNAAFDFSCNLSCPSCRKETILETEGEAEIIALQDRIAAQAFRDLHVLYVTGSGDAFGSPYFRSWLNRLPSENLPALKAIHLHTNGLLWSPGRWEKIPAPVRALIKSAEISIDAASPQTYAVNRRGGDWERLLERLDFVSQLRRDGPLEYVKIHMVVQANNYREMPDFVRLGKRLGFDSVYFSHLVNWGTFTPDEFATRTIHSPEHPMHGELVEILNQPLMEDPIVNLGNLAPYRTSARVSARKAHPEGSVGHLIETMI